MALPLLAPDLIATSAIDAQKVHLLLRLNSI
jgi:hypothetical protein